MQPAFYVKLRVRYAECDAQQVVFNARYADYADLAATEYVRAVFGGYQNLQAQGLDNQVVKLEINWQGSARFDDVLRISVATSHVGNTSFSFEMQVVNDSNQKPVANIAITYVLVDAKTFIKRTIDDQLRAQLQAGAAGQRADFSGLPSSYT